jgi:trimeric autotransporter adhesin
MMKHHKKCLIGVFLMGLLGPVHGQGIIATVAGNGIIGYSGDGGAAASAALNNPLGVAVDAFKNPFIADYANNRVRKVDSFGMISTVAGTGTAGYSGDGGLALSAKLNHPVGVAADVAGDIYVADEGNGRIRKIGTDGVITTVAGNGGAAYSGEGGPATAAEMGFPSGIAVDGVGNLYIALGALARVCKVDVSGTVSTIAGTGIVGYSGDGGSATAAQLNEPVGVGVDFSGNVFIADEFQNVVRRVNTAGIIATVAGNMWGGYAGDGGPATAAELDAPMGVAIDGSGNLFIADEGNHVIRKVGASGVISTFAGTGVQGFSGDGGAATEAELCCPAAVAADTHGGLYFCDDMRIRCVLGISSLTSPENSGKPYVVYPNPATGVATLSSLSLLGSTVEFFLSNELGEVVLAGSSPVVGGSCAVDVHGLPNGIYLLRIKGAQTVAGFKVAVNH